MTTEKNNRVEMIGQVESSASTNPISIAEKAKVAEVQLARTSKAVEDNAKLSGNYAERVNLDEAAVEVLPKPKVVVIGTVDEVGTLFSRGNPFSEGKGFSRQDVNVGGLEEQLVLFEINRFACKTFSKSDFQGASAVVCFHEVGDKVSADLFDKAKKIALEKKLYLIEVKKDNSTFSLTAFYPDATAQAVADVVASHALKVHLLEHIADVVSAHKKFVLKELEIAKSNPLNKEQKSEKRSSNFKRYIESLKSSFNRLIQAVKFSMSSIFSKPSHKNTAAKEDNKATKPVEYSA